jgi:ABC-type cobalamin transport system permease subunit
LTVDKRKTSLGKQASRFLGLPIWAGISALIAAVGVIVAIVAALLTSGAASNSVVNTVNGSCNAAGINNTVSCPEVSSDRP